jgi:hypothetical protein
MSEQETSEVKTIQNIQFSEKIPEDRPVLRYMNELAATMLGVDPKGVIRNALLSLLPEEVERRRGNQQPAS